MENLVYEIRGHKVMLDGDLARLYEIETKNLNRAFKSGIQELKDAMDLLTSKTKPAKIRFKID